MKDDLLLRLVKCMSELNKLLDLANRIGPWVKIHIQRRSFQTVETTTSESGTYMNIFQHSIKGIYYLCKVLESP